jgi:hypothetical protein
MTQSEKDVILNTIKEVGEKLQAISDGVTAMPVDAESVA